MRSAAEEPTQFLKAVMEVGAAVLKRHSPGISSRASQAALSELAEALRAQFAGQHVYMPTSCAMRLRERDAQIRRLYHQDGPNGATAGTPARARQIALVYDLTERRVRSILAGDPPAQSLHPRKHP